jgi:predicted transcriptional regulator
LRHGRSRTEIVSHILEAVAPNSDNQYDRISNEDGVTSTKIMYKAFLSYVQLKEYLSLLTENDLLQYDKTTQRYRITKKGHRFLMAYKQMNQHIQL